MQKNPKRRSHKKKNYTVHGSSNFARSNPEKSKIIKKKKFLQVKVEYKRKKKF